MVAQHTLTVFVWVQIPFPLPLCKVRTKKYIMKGCEKIPPPYANGLFVKVRTLLYASLTQLVEYLPFKQRAAGSSPAWRTKSDNPR